MPVTFKPEISIGTIVQIVVLVASGILFINRVSRDQTQILQELRVDRTRWERVEKYLSSKDPHYWEIIRHFDESQPASEARDPSASFPTP